MPDQRQKKQKKAKKADNSKVHVTVNESTGNNHGKTSAHTEE